MQHTALQRNLCVLVHESQKTNCLQVQQVINKVNGFLSFVARGMEISFFKEGYFAAV